MTPYWPFWKFRVAVYQPAQVIATHINQFVYEKKTLKFHQCQFCCPQVPASKRRWPSQSTKISQNGAVLAVLTLVDGCTPPWKKSFQDYTLAYKVFLRLYNSHTVNFKAKKYLRPNTNRYIKITKTAKLIHFGHFCYLVIAVSHARKVLFNTLKPFRRKKLT